jgi:hypothetical protein
MNTMESNIEKIDADYVLLIMNCEKYREKALGQKKTWIPEIPSNIVYYHVLGNPSLDTPFAFDEKEKILWVKTMDDYISLPKKVVASYAAIQERYTFQYIFKTDDDQILSNSRFFGTISGLLESKKPKVHYGGQHIKVEIPYLSQYYKLHPELPQDMIVQSTDYCTGRFYLLSHEAVANLITKRESVEKEYLEDYAIGLNLHPFFKKNMLPIKSDKIFTDYDSK